MKTHKKFGGNKINQGLVASSHFNEVVQQINLILTAENVLKCPAPQRMSPTPIIQKIYVDQDDIEEEEGWDAKEVCCNQIHL